MGLQELVKDKGQIVAIWETFWRLPLVFLALFAVRGACIAVLNYCFQLFRKGGHVEKLQSAGC